MTVRRRLAPIVAGLALAVTGCASQGVPMDSPSARPPFQTTSPMPTPNAGASASVPPVRWQAILDDLATRKVPADQVTLVSAESVTFNDGSLGCPEPGRMYTQALVDGMRVQVKAAGKLYDYRFGNTNTPKLCERR
ncbi:hypothetical protein ATK74_2601 [Propionicimonas paludicola]|uniref:Lipoprotein n=1 Tax=Propionicimonas paludicola TaxID=185243 RepID=A0A2A9CV56_9ACTN|nr:hypothetical protein [Propionicimonas paludicola]PFG18021.1 hypothetical protein ATK74_2601 [Propionicimonas paludicola]